jgi:hypothetical protein
VREPTRAVRAAPASLRAVLSPTRRAPAPVSKPVAQAKPSLQVIDERAPRVQIIDEPQSKIEVIE